MSDARLKELDFEAWMDLARNSPKVFETKRMAVIEEYISSVPVQQQERLRRLQWRIDVERKRAPNPLAACIRINRMMWNSLAGEQGLLDALKSFAAGNGYCNNRGSAGKIVSFPRRRADC